MTNAEIHVKAYQSIDCLVSRQKLFLQEYRERIKRLRHIAHTIAQNSVAGGGLALNVEAVSLSPEDERLLADPTHGLS